MENLFDLPSMPHGFERWPLLLVLALAPLLLFRVRGAASLLYRFFLLLALSCLVTALAGPFREEKVQDGAFAFMIDVSRSVQPGFEMGMEFLKDLLRDALSLSPGINPSIIAFGKGAGLFKSLDELRGAKGASFMREAGHATVFNTALLPLLNSLPDRKEKRVLLLSDGNFDLSGFERVAGMLKGEGVRFYVKPVGVAGRDKRIEGIEYEPVVFEGEEWRVKIETNGEDKANIEFGDGAKYDFRRAGEGLLEVSRPFDEEGFVTFTVRLGSEDPFPENDSVSGVIRVKELPGVWLFGGDGGMMRTLREGGLSVYPSGPEGLRVEGVLEDIYEKGGVLFLNNIDFKGLPLEIPDRLEGFVQRGGGVVILCGEGGLEIPEEGGEPLTRLLPVKVPEKEKKEKAPLSVIFVLDRSDSMGREHKFEVAVEATARAIEKLSEEAEVGVVIFSDFPEWVSRLKKSRDTALLREKLRGLRVKGGTSLYPPIREAGQALRKTDAFLKHIILLTDGVSITRYEQNSDIVDRLREDKVTISTVGIGGDVDADHLKTLARVTGGRFYYVEDFRKVPEILVEETLTVMREKVKEEARRVIVARRVEGFPSLISLAQDPSFQGVSGFVESIPKPTANLVLSTDNLYPIFINHVFGKGKVSLFTSWGEGLSPSLFEHHLATPALREVVMDTVRGGVSPHIIPSVDMKDGMLSLSVRTRDLTGNPVNGLKTSLKLHSPAGGTEVLEIPQKGPGLYFIAMRLERGPFFMEVEQSGKEFSGRVVIPTPVPRFSEIEKTGIDMEKLERVANLTGGSIDPDPVEFFLKGLPERVERKGLEGLFISLSIPLFLLSLLLRKAGGS